MSETTSSDSKNFLDTDEAAEDATLLFGAFEQLLQARDLDQALSIPGLDEKGLYKALRLVHYLDQSFDIKLKT